MNLKVICIDEGHTVSGSDYGTQGNGLYESIETRELGSLIKKYVEQLGVKIDKCTIDYANSVSDSINKRLAIANSKAYDLVLIIHFNSFSEESANGCEVFILPNKNGYYSSNASYNTNLKYGREILDAVCTTGGFYKRGGDVKFRDDLGMLLYPKSYAVYLEVCFLTNKKDADKYKTNKDKIARAIAEVISGKKLNTNNNVKVEYDMNKIVVYFGDADLFGAIMVAQKNQCPLMKLSDYKASGLKAQTVIQIGGKAEDKNRYVTFKNAAALV